MTKKAPVTVVCKAAEQAVLAEAWTVIPRTLRLQALNDHGLPAKRTRRQLESLTATILVHLLREQEVVLQMKSLKVVWTSVKVARAVKQTNLEGERQEEGVPPYFVVKGKSGTFQRTYSRTRKIHKLLQLSYQVRFKRDSSDPVISVYHHDTSQLEF